MKHEKFVMKLIFIQFNASSISQYQAISNSFHFFVRFLRYSTEMSQGHLTLQNDVTSRSMGLSLDSHSLCVIRNCGRSPLFGLCNSSPTMMAASVILLLATIWLVLPRSVNIWTVVFFVSYRCGSVTLKGTILTCLLTYSMVQSPS